MPTLILFFPPQMFGDFLLWRSQVFLTNSKNQDLSEISMLKVAYLVISFLYLSALVYQAQKRCFLTDFVFTGVHVSVCVSVCMNLYIVF